MNAHPWKSRILLAPLAAVGLALGSWMATPAMAGCTEVSAGSCCHAQPTSQCCKGACCQSPAPNPALPPANPIVTSNEGPQDVNFTSSGFASPHFAGRRPSASQPYCLAVSGTGSSSLTAQHVRLQI